ncbi:hypothetical protein HY003_01290 [Candidatus Saccharibacteria bacterium]|nr:hypothetical protein [Candidatus Saccharibacteria bacterium]MBI3337912.1 hypothetical protein [Candidatus Saccharibacteria bacterium]
MPIRNKTSEIIDLFVVGVATAGVVGLTIMAPNSLVALEKILDNFLTGRDKKHEAKRIAKYLKQRKLVSVEEQVDGDYRVTLTDGGSKRSQIASFERLELPNIRWDGKWRIVTFDIPEQHKQVRDYLSRHMKRVGFKQLQRSVFVYPYGVEEFVAILFDIYPEVKKYFVYAVAEDVSNHNQLVKQFKNILR